MEQAIQNQVCIDDVLEQAGLFFEAQGVKAYITGGYLRNRLFGLTGYDIDLVADGEVMALGRQLAGILKGSFAVLDPVQNTARVALEGSTPDLPSLLLDITRMRGGSLEADMRLRDFTINALALHPQEHRTFSEILSTLPFETFPPRVPAYRALDISSTSHDIPVVVTLSSFPELLGLLDYCGGLADIRHGILRMIHKDVFKYDPLRMLRAVRFAACYGLRIEAETERAIFETAALLDKVAVERIHDEFCKIITLPWATSYLRYLDKCRLLTRIWPYLEAGRGLPQPGGHYWDVFEHSLETVTALDQVMDFLSTSAAGFEWGGLNSTLLQHSSQILSAEQTRLTFCKVAALLHDIGKPPTFQQDGDGRIRFYGHPEAGVPLAREMLEHLKFSTRATEYITTIVLQHMRPGQLSEQLPVTDRAIRRYFRDMGQVGIDVALVSLADHLAMSGPNLEKEHWQRHLSVVHSLISTYYATPEKISPPQLLNGLDIMVAFQLQPGPQIGTLLEQLHEAQAEGVIQTKEEALELVQRILTS